ncbi:MAG: hypothetical protein GSR80_001380 [Desulfurococcales archaeon]|nr:hypothetical protein [Desulfurococcales archaeon]
MLPRRVVERVKKMSVAWFSFNLATSAIVLSTFALGNLEGYGWMLGLARLLAYINTATFALAAVLYAARVVLGFESFKAVARSPVEGPFLSTIGIATMTLSLDWSLVLGRVGVAAALFYVGLAIHTVIFVVVMYHLERHPGIEVHYMNPSWYMPAVGNVLAPYVGMILAGKGVPVSESLLGIYLGTGTIMWIALFAIWLYRAIFYSPPPARLMATTWINLAPPAVIPLSYEALLGFTPGVYASLYREAAQGPASPVVASLLAAVFDFFYYTFWGAAGLLFALVIAITADHARKGDIEFAESWWAFVFPLAAYSISTIHLYLHHPQDRWLVPYAWLLYTLAWAAYLATTGLTLYYEYAEVVRGKPEEELPRIARPLEEELASPEAAPAGQPRPRLQG